ncbi:hypothetical protein [Vulcanisaeta souniana]|uniref:ArnR1-like winged helix-turn-helix domain-containing protein n=1 Tax=Vulcanisaeta souniana JCM 11219 TaxID=1293586 RepID=A0A830E665_9CREN|nr:hypothetical protein [Vulcanisaeta souniana]BDR92275.1 hypothetical protein Vsou_13680 [Vulcanisaeta souniana JCM 11219]GGI86413.1 hypothetical protein GCM10007112_24260 [Vulcanisaeta souniana JCM 11219]
MPAGINNEAWNEIGLAGLKVIMGLALVGGVGGWVDIVRPTRIGRGTWERAREVLVRYGLAIEEQRGREVQLRLTERGWAVAKLLFEIDSILSSSSMPSTTTSSPG